MINIVLSRPLLEALLFSLAIAIGITPQLLPAIVSVSLASGSRHLARSRVLVKRLVTIEDLGNIELLFTDKTGTLTEGCATKPPCHVMARSAGTPSTRPCTSHPMPPAYSPALTDRVPIVASGHCRSTTIVNWRP